MFKLKSVLSAGLSLALAASLAACNGSKGTTNQTTAPVNPGAEVQDTDTRPFTGRTLDVGIWGGNDAETRSIEQVKADFEALTGASVNLKVYTEYEVQLEADFVARTAPDTFYIDASMFDYFADLGVLTPLDSAEMSAGAFYPNMIDAFTANDGNLYALPKDLSTLALYYNTDLLTEAGFTADDIPEALEDYVAFLPKLQAALDAKYGAGQVAAMTYNLELPRNLHLLQKNGAQLTDASGNSTLIDPGVAENFAFIKSLTDTGAYKTPKDLGTGWNGEAFGTGKTVLMEEGNWVYGTLKNDFSDVNFGIKDMPSYKGEKSSMLFTVGYGVYSNSPNQDLAKEWIKYATGPDGMYTWCSGVGTLPSRVDVADRLSGEQSAELKTHLAQVAYSSAWQLGINGTVINNAYKNFMPEAINGTSTIETALGKADTQANQQIANS